MRQSTDAGGLRKFLVPLLGGVVGMDRCQRTKKRLHLRLYGE